MRTISSPLMVLYEVRNGFLSVDRPWIARARLRPGCGVQTIDCFLAVLPQTTVTGINLAVHLLPNLLQLNKSAAFKISSLHAAFHA